jgi:hypothetical protein
LRAFIGSLRRGPATPGRMPRCVDGAIMSRGPCTFKQSDVTKAVKAVVAAGVDVARVEVGKDGRIVVIAGKPSPDKEKGGGEWDRI